MKAVPFLDLAPMHKLIGHEIRQAFDEVYAGNSFLLGRHLQQFEKAFATFNEVSHCIGTSNGLDALRICLEALDIGPGDEVIIPGVSFIATSLAVLHTGATPVFADIDKQTYTLCPSSLESSITPRTKAIIPVHLYGQSCNMASIAGVARKHGLYIIEDNAQAQGGRFNGRLTGNWGTINATSFYPCKNLGALGDAGAVTTSDEHLARRARLLRNYGSEQKYHHECAGFNMRMDECQAAFLTIKLRHLAHWTEQRRQIAEWYSERLRGIGDLHLPHSNAAAYHVYHLYVIRTSKRNLLQQCLSSKGISTLIHYPVPLHLEKVHHFLSFKKGDLPVAEKHAAACLSLPLWPGMDEYVVDGICKAIQKFYA